MATSTRSRAGGALVLPVCLLAAVTFTLPTTATGQSWEFETVLDLGAVYTDNLFLAEDGMEETDVVWRIAPTFSLTKESDRIDADLRYMPEALLYTEAEDADGVFHSVDADLTATLVSDALFLNLRAVNFQSIVSPEITIPTSNIPVTGNRVDSRVFGVRPYWEQTFGSVQSRIEVDYIVTRFDEPEDIVGSFIQDNDQSGGLIRFDNLERGEGFAWAVEYTSTKVEYKDALPWEYQQAFLNVGYWLGSNFRAFVQSGIETPYDAILDSSMEDDFWEAGFQIVASRRLDLEVAAGQRSFGDTIRVDLEYELRRGQTSLTYVEGPSTRGENIYQRQPLAGTDNLDGLLDRPFASDRYILSRGEWATAIELARSEFTLRVFMEDRDQRTTDTGTELEDERFEGIALRWQWNFGDNSALGIAGDLTRRETDTIEDEIRRYAIDYSYYFSPRYAVVLLAQQSQQEGAIFSDNDYTENQVQVFLRAEF